jgi:hypothetical protein
VVLVENLAKVLEFLGLGSSIAGRAVAKAVAQLALTEPVVSPAVRTRVSAEPLL